MWPETFIHEWKILAGILTNTLFPRKALHKFHSSNTTSWKLVKELPCSCGPRCIIKNGEQFIAWWFSRLTVQLISRLSAPAAEILFFFLETNRHLPRIFSRHPLETPVDCMYLSVVARLHTPMWKNSQKIVAPHAVIFRGVVVSGFFHGNFIVSKCLRCLRYCIEGWLVCRW